VFASEPEGFGRQARRLRLNTLIGLRWLAVAGQTAAILIGVFGLGLRFPVLACLGLVAPSAALNLALRYRFPISTQLSERAATIMLAYDILQLAGLLFLTGGVANPFVILLLAPVTIAATSLSLRQALALLGLALVSATVLLRVSLPLPWISGESLIVPPLYVVARWVALAVSAAFVALYAYRVAEEARQSASALTAAELVLARAQHLVAPFLQSLYRLHARGIARRDEGGDHTHAHSDRDGHQQELRVDQNLAGVVGDAEQLVHQVAGDLGEAAREGQARDRADGRPDEAGDGALGEEQGADLGPSRSEGAQNSDLRAALRHRDGEGIIDDEHPDEQGEEAGDAGNQGIDGQQGFELAAAAGRGLDGEAGTESLLEGRRSFGE